MEWKSVHWRHELVISRFTVIVFYCIIGTLSIGRSPVVISLCICPCFDSFSRLLTIENIYMNLINNEWVTNQYELGFLDLFLKELWTMTMHFTIIFWGDYSCIYCLKIYTWICIVFWKNYGPWTFGANIGTKWDSFVCNNVWKCII